MAKKKNPTDVNVTSFKTLREVTKDENKPRLAPSVKRAGESDTPLKNLVAAPLGHLGGLKGGKARADALSKKRSQK